MRDLAGGGDGREAGAGATWMPWLLSMETVCTVPVAWTLQESQSTSSTPETTSAKTTWHGGRGVGGGRVGAGAGGGGRGEGSVRVV